MKNIKCLILLLSFLFLFASCKANTPKDKNEIVSDSASQTNSTYNSNSELANKKTIHTNNTTDKPEDTVKINANQDIMEYGFFNGVSTPYKEYISDLKYLEEIEAKVSNSTTTVDNSITLENAFNAWDKELNKIYSLLSNKLPEEKFEKLKIEERLWIKEKEETVNNIKAMGGSQNTVDFNDYLFRETKQRTLELIHMYFEHEHDKSAAFEAYNAIIQNKTKFFSQADNKDVYLQEFYKELYANIYSEPDPDIEYILSKLHFAMVDLDSDGVVEIILSIKDIDHMVILHYEDGTVYAHGAFGNRQMGGIKTDGSFGWSGGAGYSGYSKIQFFGITYNFKELASYETISYQEGSSEQSVYLIGSKTVTKDEYFAFQKEQELKEYAIWRPFNENNNNDILNMYAESKSNFNKNEAMEALKSVLQNETKLYSTNENKYVYFKDSAYLSDIPHDNPLSWVTFTIVDMDGDGIDEVVLTANDSYGFETEVLRYDSGTVYSYGFGFRHMYYLKTDGSYCWTNGAENSGHEKLQFFGVKYRGIELDSYKDDYDDEGNYLETTFYINNEPVTTVEADLFSEQQNKKEDAIWFDFNADNIELQIVCK